MQDLFSYYIHRQTILADVTVGCQSNSHRVSSISDLLAPAAKAVPAGPPTPASCGRLCCRVGLSAPTTPTTGQGIPLLTHNPCYSAATAASHRSRTSEPSYSSPRGLPLPRLPRLRVVPFLGLTVVLSAWRGQCGQRPTSFGRVLYVERVTAGSMAAAGSTAIS